MRGQNIAARLARTCAPVTTWAGAATADDAAGGSSTLGDSTHACPLRGPRQRAAYHGVRGKGLALGQKAHLPAWHTFLLPLALAVPPPLHLSEDTK